MSFIEKAVERLRNSTEEPRTATPAPEAAEKPDQKRRSGKTRAAQRGDERQARVEREEREPRIVKDDRERHPGSRPAATAAQSAAPVIEAAPPAPQPLPPPVSRRQISRDETVAFATPDTPRSTPIQVDMRHLDSEGYLSSQRNNAEEYRRLKRPLLSVAFGSRKSTVADGNLLMVTSALPGDGKTFTSVNLAMSMCQELDRTVLLIDADVAKSHISRLFSVDDRPGLTDLLINDDMDLSDVLLSPNIAGRITFLPSGQRNAQSTELLASERMAELTREVAQRYPDRMIIFDSPPLLATSEAQVLSSLVGQVLLVVQAGVTPQNALRQAIEMLDPSKAISLVLNRSASTILGYYDSYYGDG